MARENAMGQRRFVSEKLFFLCMAFHFIYKIMVLPVTSVWSACIVIYSKVHGLIKPKAKVITSNDSLTYIKDKNMPPTARDFSLRRMKERKENK